MNSPTKLLVRYLCVIGLVGCSIRSATAGTWEFIPGREHHATVSQADGIMDVRSSGNDPFLVGKVAKLDPQDRVLEFEYTCVEGVDSVQIYLGPPLGKDASCDLAGFTNATTWSTYSGEITGGAKKSLTKNPTLMRIDLGRKAGVRLQLRNVRLRPQTADEVQRSIKRDQERLAKKQEGARISEYLKASFPLKIDTVVVEEDQIVLTGGSVPATISASDLRLIEFPPWHSIGMAGGGIQTNATLHSAGDAWRAVVPRRESGRDRLHSGWRLSYEKEGIKRFVTSRRFATQIDPVTSNYPAQPLRPKNQKGMGGIERNAPMDELLELGVTAMTVNISLNAFVAEREHPTNQRLEVPGEPVFFNPRAFQIYDPMIDWARENEIVVTAILLVATPKNNNRPSPLVHPENSGGVYAMPDLATSRGSIIYAHVLDKLAKHFGNSERSPGGITNWIAHNEIDFHTQWTNMGPQPREVVGETYYRSMRMISNAARQHNPHARVFTSTTHNWYVPDDGKTQNLSPA